jgi:hypothetical protein
VETGTRLARIANLSSRLGSASGEVDRGGRSRHSLEAALLAATPFVLAPLLVASSNDPDPVHLGLGSWLALLVLAVVAYLVLVVAQLVAARLRLGRSFRRLTRLACYFVVLSCFALPLVGHTGLVEPELAQFLGQNLLFAMTASVTLLIMSQRWLPLVRQALVIYVAANLLLTVYPLIEDKRVDARHPLSASSERNIFVLSFDGLSGSAMAEVLRSGPALSAEFEGFVVFDSVASSSPGTSASIAAELSGNTNFKEFAQSTTELWESAPQDLLTNVLIENDYEVTTYGVYGRSLNSRGIRIRPSTWPESTTIEVLDLALARTLSPAIASKMPISQILEASPSFDVFEDSVDSSAVQDIQDSLSPSWDKNLTLSVADFESLFDGLSVGADNPAAFFLHFTHTHYPVEWGSSCSFHGDDPTWFSNHQNYEGVIEESTCAVRQMAEFVAGLRNLGVLDKSLVVLKSDHGKPVDYAPENSIESVPINNHALWGLSRYAPFLAVRLGDAAGELTYDSSAVLLDDLARTICQEADIDYDCTRFPGYNILRESHSIDPASQVTAFVVKSPDSDYRFDEHQPISFSRGDNVLQSLYNTLLAARMVDEFPKKVSSLP